MREGRLFACRISVICISPPSGALNNMHHFLRGGRKESHFSRELEVLQHLLKQALMKHDVHLPIVHNTVGEMGGRMSCTR